MLDAEALLAHLVAAEHQLQAVGLTELGCDILSEGDADTPLRRRAASSRIWVAPEHLHHQALIIRLTLAIYPPDVVERYAVLGKEATMDDKDSAVQHMAKRQEVEGLAKEQVE